MTDYGMKTHHKQSQWCCAMCPSKLADVGYLQHIQCCHPASQQMAFFLLWSNIFWVQPGKRALVNNCLTHRSVLPQYKITLSAVPDLPLQVWDPQYTKLRLDKLSHSSVLALHGRSHLTKHNYHNCKSKSKYKYNLFQYLKVLRNLVNSYLQEMLYVNPCQQLAEWLLWGYLRIYCKWSAFTWWWHLWIPLEQQWCTLKLKQAQPIYETSLFSSQLRCIGKYQRDLEDNLFR